MRSCTAWQALRVLCLALGLLNTPALDPRKLPSQHVAQQWNMEVGLPDSYVQAIIQTRDGYLWIGTQNSGLVRFDGVEFKQMDPGFGRKPSETSIRAFCETPDGTLWIGTDGAGLWAMQHGRFVEFVRANGLTNENIRALHAAKDGSLLVASAVGVQRVRGRAFGPIEGESRLRNILAMCDGPDGSTWFAGNGLWRFSEGQITDVAAAMKMPADRFQDLAFDSAGALWLASNNGLLRLHNGHYERFSEVDGLSDRRLRSVHCDVDGNIWVGSNSGLDRVANGRIQQCLTREAVPYDLVYDIFEDREGCLWIGSNGGLARLKDEKFTLLTTSEGLPQNVVLAAIQARDRSFWVGTWTKGVAQISDQGWRRYTVKEGLVSDEVRSLHEDREGGIWVGTEGGAISNIRQGVVTTYHVPELKGEAAESLQSDFTDGLWIVSEFGEVLRERGREFSLANLGPAYLGRRTYTLHRSNESLWFATDLAINQKRGDEWKAFPLPAAVVGKTIRSIYETSDGDLWICALNSGLVRLRDGNFKIYSVDDGLVLDNFYTVIEDRNNDLWVGCRRGVFLFTSQDLLDFDTGKNQILHPLDYTQLSGLHNPRFTRYGFPLTAKLADGRLCFPTTKGVAIIDAGRMPFNTVPPPVVIEGFNLDGVDYPATDMLTIPAGTRDIEIRYTALSLRAPERVRFRYRLGGVEEQWVEAENRRVAYFQHLQPGVYEFQVVAANEDGVWNLGGARTRFVKEPMVYQTATFRALCVLALGSLVWSFQRARLNQERKRFNAMVEERTRIARELHDTLEQGLVGVSMQLNLAAAKAVHPNGSSSAQRHLDKARYMLTHSMADARASILDLRRESAPKDLLEELRAIAESLTEESGITVTAAENGLRKDLSLFAETTLLRIGQEAITNILKHAGATAINLELDFGADCVTLRIADNGNGFDPSSLEAMDHGHFGLLGMRERAEKLTGKLSVNSSRGRGTILEVSLPLRSGIVAHGADPTARESAVSFLI